MYKSYIDIIMLIKYLAYFPPGNIEHSLEQTFYFHQR